MASTTVPATGAMRRCPAFVGTTRFAAFSVLSTRTSCVVAPVSTTFTIVTAIPGTAGMVIPVSRHLQHPLHHLRHLLAVLRRHRRVSTLAQPTHPRDLMSVVVQDQSKIAIVTGAIPSRVAHVCTTHNAGTIVRPTLTRCEASSVWTRLTTVPATRATPSRPTRVIFIRHAPTPVRPTHMSCGARVVCKQSGTVIVIRDTSGTEASACSTTQQEKKIEA